MQKIIQILLTISLLFNLACCSSQARLQFQEFMAEYQKEYSTPEEYLKRFQIFEQNLQKIKEVQASETGTAVYGITKFMDLTQEEFRNTILLPKSQPTSFPEEKYIPADKYKNINRPDSFNWTEKGAVTPIKDQGSVGTCWSFSTTGNIEGQWFLTHNKLISLSEQQIVDCDATIDPPKADCGVFGGWPYLAMEYVIKTGGLPSDADYPYCVGISGKDACYPCSAKGYNETLCGPGLHPPSCNDTKYPCKQGKVPVSVYINDWKAISKDEDVIADQLTQIGPFSIAIDATGLQFYKHGVHAPVFCSKKDLDHAVLMTGYGVEKDATKGDIPYWIVKNSWGHKWGMDGYFLMKRGVGMCGINTQVITSIIHNNEVQ